MEKGVIAQFFEKQGYKNINVRVVLALIFLTIAFIIFLLFMLFFNTGTCKDLTCFREAMADCSRVSCIKEDDQASWQYKITGMSGADSCEVEVVLINMKRGSIDSEKLRGESMVCDFPRLSASFPEKDMSRCTGILKEDLQEIIISRMHSYLLQNLGEIESKFQEI
jgi:hypothetical protein